jgi:hypothetical protein
LGRSRGGLTTKLHLLAEGNGRELVKRVTPGQAADTKELVSLLDAVAVPRPDGVGRHRKRLDHLTADKAYGSKANRRSLRARGIAHTIPERADVQASRARKGSRGGRPPNFNASRYTDRNRIEMSKPQCCQTCGWALRSCPFCGGGWLVGLARRGRWCRARRRSISAGSAWTIHRWGGSGCWWAVTQPRVIQL